MAQLATTSPLRGISRGLRAYHKFQPLSHFTINAKAFTSILVARYKESTLIRGKFAGFAVAFTTMNVEINLF